jgi:hypothetical protein
MSLTYSIWDQSKVFLKDYFQLVTSLWDLVNCNFQLFGLNEYYFLTSFHLHQMNILLDRALTMYFCI